MKSFTHERHNTFNTMETIYIGSGMARPYNLLSNFSECTIVGEVYIKKDDDSFEIKNYTFPCSEHYFWAHFMYRDCDIKRLAIGGDMSTLEGLKFFFKEDVYVSKVKFWSKKKNVGIVAKMLANRSGIFRKRADKLGFIMSIHPLVQYGEQGTDETLFSIWKKILFHKYTQNKDHRDILEGTGNKRIVEFCRMKPENQFWAGQVVGGTRMRNKNISGGDVVGFNYMGKMLMMTRDLM